MNILFLCGREAYYPLNQVLIESLRKFSNVEVLLESAPCQSILRRSLQLCFQGIPKILSKPYDLVFVSFYGNLLMLPFGTLSRQPVIFHPFISTYETLVFDRKKYADRSLAARMAYWLDKAACKSATHILLDTQANIDYFSKTFSIPIEGFSKLFLGSDERLFFPRPRSRKDNKVIVLYHGSYLPLQGIDVIIHAAHRLINHPDVRFHMLGRGLGYDRIYELSRGLNLTNMEFLEGVPLQELPKYIAEADICLGGHFGTSDKALRVIAGKTFQDLAMGKATIVGDTPANRELLQHGHDAWFSAPDDPEALADAIKALADDPALRSSIGENAHTTFLSRASLKALVPELKKVVYQVTG